MPTNRRTYGAAQHHLTQEERTQLYTALFSRALREIDNGVMKEAQIAVELLERMETGAGTSAEVLAWLRGDDGIPDET